MTTMIAVPIERELAPEDFSRIVEADGPLHGQPIPDPRHTRFTILEVGDQIVGYWGLYDTLHAEPVWIHPDYRQHPAVAKLLLEGLGRLLQDLGATFVFGIIADEDVLKNLPLAERLGFERIPGSLYGVRVNPLGGT